jgi:hypothetical protein
MMGPGLIQRSLATGIDLGVSRRSRIAKRRIEEDVDKDNRFDWNLVFGAAASFNGPLIPRSVDTIRW